MRIELSADHQVAADRDACRYRHRRLRCFIIDTGYAIIAIVRCKIYTLSNLIIITDPTQLAIDVQSHFRAVTSYGTATPLLSAASRCILTVDELANNV